MRPLSASELLTVWEHSLAQRPAQRVLALLAAASPEKPAQELAELSIGQRDAQLLSLREMTFGRELQCQAACPTCNERIEAWFNTADIRALHDEPSGGTLSLSEGAWQVRFRLPNSSDLLAISASDEVDAVRKTLLDRCVLGLHRKGEEVPIEHLPAQVRNAVVGRMERADSQSDVRLGLSCSECGHQWQTSFDIGAFFWREVSDWALRLLRDVHRLATAYGWREADILAMSPLRRQAYLEMAST